MHGSTFVAGTGTGFQSGNLTQALRDQGVMAPTPLEKFYDLSGTLGGPVRTDRIWYFLNAHSGGYTRDTANIFYNLNAGDPVSWLYSPDYGRPDTGSDVRERQRPDHVESDPAKQSWDVLGRTITLSALHGRDTWWFRSGSSVAGGRGHSRPPAPCHTSDLVVASDEPSPHRRELRRHVPGSGQLRTPAESHDRPDSVVEQCANGCPANGGIPGLVYRSQDFSSSHNSSYLWKASLSHVTGSHSFKVGYQQAFLTDDRTWFTNHQNLTYRVNNGEPNQLTESVSPWVNDTHIGWAALFAQEQWTRDRVTLQGAVRFDRAESWFPVQQEGPSRFLPAAIVVPETRGVDSYKDITPRVGVTYDVFGTARTALKLQLGKYLEGAGTVGNYASSNPTLRMPQTTQSNGTAGVTRSWVDANGNFAPDCDLLNPAAQDLRSAAGDFCGPISDRQLRNQCAGQQLRPGILNGWGLRPSDWDLDLSIQQQVFSRAS